MKFRETSYEIFHSYAGERWQECEIRYCDNGEARK